MISPTLWPERATDLYEFSPAVDIYEKGNAVVVKADLPGLKKDDIKIDLTENLLTISGKREEEKTIEKENFFRHERMVGAFSRSVELPSDLDTEKVEAHFKDGILEVTIPMLKEAEMKHKKISIS